MRSGKRTTFMTGLGGALCSLGLITAANAAVTTYSGNGNTGFGGTLGNGSLTFSDSGGNLTATFNPSGGFGGNDVVVYIDSVGGGFADTSQFSDNGDGGRQSISANNNGNPSRDLITFPTGFAADYAIEFENNTYIGLFGLAAGGNNSLNYITGTGPASGGPYTVTFPLSSIGLTQGQSFKLVADLMSTSGYGSNETVGASVTVPDNGGDAPNAGFNGSTTFVAADSYSTTAVPEPVGLAGLALSGSMLMRRRSNRH